MAKTSRRKLTYPQHTSDGVLTLLTIDHPDLSEPLRIVNLDKSQVSSNGDTYIGTAFDFTFPDSPEEGFGGSKLEIDNVDRVIGATLRAIQSPAIVTAQLAHLEDPDNVERTFTGLKLRNVSGDAGRIKGDLAREEFDAERFPHDTVTLTNFPGLRG